MKRYFSGGVQLRDGKALSQDTPIIKVSPPQVAVSLAQHTGEVCRPLVRMGQRVLLGQMIGGHDGHCAPVHAPVSGVVRAVEMRRQPGGGFAQTVIIDNDERGERADCLPISSGDADSLLARIRAAGVVGMGGAAFPSGIKAGGVQGRTEVLIANGCECEPYITADACLLAAVPRQVLKGLTFLQQIIRPNRTVLAVESNKTAAIAAIRKELPHFPEIHLAVLPARYPQGAEKQLIFALTGREVPGGKLPGAVGCAVFNVSTCAAICRAVEEGRPLTERLITVSGPGIVRPGNYLVPIGTPIREVLNAAGGLRRNADRVICGGPMMGTAQTDLDVGVSKATNALICLTRQPRRRTGACIHCGRCVAVCPMRLQPLYLYQAGADDAELARLGLEDCLLCGCCSYRCPAGIPLTEQFRRQKNRRKEEAV